MYSVKKKKKSDKIEMKNKKVFIEGKTCKLSLSLSHMHMCTCM